MSAPMDPVDLFVGTTSFRQGEVDRTHRVWTLLVPPGRDFQVSVHRHKNYPPTQWLASCEAMNISCLKLAAVDAPTAKLEALHAIGDILANRLKRINSALALMNPDPDATVPLEASPPPPSD